MNDLQLIALMVGVVAFFLIGIMMELHDIVGVFRKFFDREVKK
jgi:hypothetical protein